MADFLFGYFLFVQKCNISTLLHKYPRVTISFIKFLRENEILYAHDIKII